MSSYFVSCVPHYSTNVAECRVEHTIHYKVDNFQTSQLTIERPEFLLAWIKLYSRIPRFTSENNVEKSIALMCFGPANEHQKHDNSHYAAKIFGKIIDEPDFRKILKNMIVASTSFAVKFILQAGPPIEYNEFIRVNTKFEQTGKSGEFSTKFAV